MATASGGRSFNIEGKCFKRMDDELVAKAREALQARLRSVEPEKVIQYNLVIPITADQLEKIINAINGK